MISLCSGIGRRLFFPAIATVGSFVLLHYLLQKFTPGITSPTTANEDKESSLNLHYNLLGETAARLLQSPRGFFDESECNLGKMTILYHT